LKMDRIMIAAPKSGSGKTLLTCALLEALKSGGKKPAAFKCGPDYIDPMFHKKVIGIPSRNLDPFFTDRERTIGLFEDEPADRGISVIEGVMGLFDGLGGTTETASSYHLAVMTKTPILLVIDARGMGRSILAVIEGFLRYDREHLIRGVILNRTTKSFYNLIAPVIEEAFPIKVIGYFPQDAGLRLESRHLGLCLPEEKKELKEQVARAAALARQSLDFNALFSIAASAEPLPKIEDPFFKEEPKRRVRLALADDEAFRFFYEDNLRLLRKAGAELVSFSPIHDRRLPDRIGGILLYGGYPELYAAKLAANDSMKDSLRGAIAGKTPSVAECGGFMYLCSEMEDTEGNVYPMIGAVKGRCSYQGKLVRFGYVTLESGADSFLPRGEKIRGHEFHYFDSPDNGTDCTAVKPVTGRSWPCVQADGTRFWGFPHLYYYSNPDFVSGFLRKAGEFNEQDKR